MDMSTLEIEGNPSEEELAAIFCSFQSYLKSIQFEDTKDSENTSKEKSQSTWELADKVGEVPVLNRGQGESTNESAWEIMSRHP